MANPHALKTQTDAHHVAPGIVSVTRFTGGGGAYFPRVRTPGYRPLGAQIFWQVLNFLESAYPASPAAAAENTDRYGKNSRTGPASQKAAIAAELLPAFEAEAKQRQKERKGNQPGASTEKIPDLGEAREKAAEAVGVNPRYVSEAKKLRDTEANWE